MEDGLWNESAILRQSEAHDSEVSSKSSDRQPDQPPHGWLGRKRSAEPGQEPDAHTDCRTTQCEAGSEGAKRCSLRDGTSPA